MGIPTDPEWVLPILAAFSRYPAALDWAQAKAESLWGPLHLASPAFDFAETSYYDQSMGPGLKKAFWVPKRLADPAELVLWKLVSGDWEREYAAISNSREERPLNLDPGYLTEAKLVLASTKDHAHRIYLSHGIYAEVTLFFKHKRWQDRDWTFPDYRRTDYQQFFTQCRDYLRDYRRERGRTEEPT